MREAVLIPTTKFYVIVLILVVLTALWLARNWRRINPIQRRLDIVIMAGVSFQCVHYFLMHSHKIYQPVRDIAFALTVGFVIYYAILLVQQRRADNGLNGER